jgi:D-arabinose 1-dehydrogenase-like Zn-dependent alcohol dehydrogenase
VYFIHIIFISSLFLKMPSPSNQAAWLIADKAIPLSVSSAPYPSPEPNEIIIRPGAVAINPADFAMQARGKDLFPFLTYPRTLGMDLSGTVVEVGSAVTRFKPGDRVLAHSDQLKMNSAGAFQLFVVAQDNMSSQIPDSMEFEDACVLPACLSVAAVGLFQKDYLALQYPTVPPKPTGKSLVLWGRSTSVGSNAIQLGVAAGYEVITTCSPRNFAYVKKLGASHVFDYSSPTAVTDILAVLKGKICAGAVAIGNYASPGNGTVAGEACLEIVEKSEGKKFVAMAMMFQGTVPEGIEMKFIWGSALKDNEVGKVVFEEFLPEALEEGSYLCAPDPVVVGKGLERIQEAFEVAKKGVSAKKVVVSL